MLIFLLMIILLAGCSAEKQNEIPSVPSNIENVETFNAIDEKKSFDLYIESNIKLQKCEPPKGIYLGAYILSNKRLNSDIKTFEKVTGKKHAMYTYTMKLGDKLPEDAIYRVFLVLLHRQ